ncbi:MAG: efflux RND transporter periplasmic adaptor subunit [Bacteroidetes bacterium]|nr:MAG: efflux RND transporter periplasmic adaptor subunit [Bacteroidota bacterium]
MKSSYYIIKNKAFSALNKRFLIVLGVLGAVILSACHSEEHKAEEQVKFLVSSPYRKDTVFTKEYVCQIRSVQHIELRALEKGYLQQIYVDEGQHVKKGQVMFQIMPMLYEAEMKKAQAEVSFAEIEYKNTKQLADQGIVSGNELALAKAKYDKAKAELQLSQVHLNFTKVTAPFDGIMDRFHVRLGSLLDEGELLTTLSANDKMWIYFNVPEAEYLNYMSKIKTDSSTSVKLLMANRKLFKYPGKVTAIEADFNNETGNIAFRATFPNPERLLRYGETGNILMEVPLKGALLIPQKATYEILDKKYVYVIDKNNTVRSRKIEIGEEFTHLYVVKKGLKEGDKILIEGLRKVRSGQKIKYDFEKPEKVVSHLELFAE